MAGAGTEDLACKWLPKQNRRAPEIPVPMRGIPPVIHPERCLIVLSDACLQKQPTAAESYPYVQQVLIALWCAKQLGDSLPFLWNSASQDCPLYNCTRCLPHPFAGHCASREAPRPVRKGSLVAAEVGCK